jgi:hypothetical protein
MATIAETLRRTPLAGPDDRRCLPHGLFWSPQYHSLETAPIPSNAYILDEPCSPLGAMLCGAVSTLSGEPAVERRSRASPIYNPMERVVSNAAHNPFRTPDSTGSSCLLLPLAI